MARLIIIAVVITLLLVGVRRALAAGRPARRRRRRADKADGGQLGPPERLVCGACGAEFDADKHGWVCPHCGK